MPGRHCSWLTLVCSGSPVQGVAEELLSAEQPLDQSEESRDAEPAAGFNKELGDTRTAQLATLAEQADLRYEQPMVASFSAMAKQNGAVHQVKGG